MIDINLRSHWFTWPLRGKWYKTSKTRWFDGHRERELEVTISPAGRSCRVHLDGKELS